MSADTPLNGNDEMAPDTPAARDDVPRRDDLRRLEWDCLIAVGRGAHTTEAVRDAIGESLHNQPDASYQYRVLRQLTAKGLVTTTTVDRRHEYRITKKGQQALARTARWVLGGVEQLPDILLAAIDEELETRENGETTALARTREQNFTPGGDER